MKHKKNLSPTRSGDKKYIDSDADGLTDNQEKNLGTNPKNKDSDHDGLDDYEEVDVYNTNPLNSDTDKDGMKDGQEVKRGRNPKGTGTLKNFFIPSKENNYYPRSLEPKRLAFYAISSLAIKTILVVFLIILPISAWLTPDLLLEQSQKIIQLTNSIRNNLGIETLIESNLLNQAALNKANDMLNNQYFAHTSPDQKDVASWLAGVDYNYSFAGENLAIGFASAEDVINAWTQSQTHYNNMIDLDFSEIGVGMISGLYNNYETTLVAQYFAAPKIAPTVVSPKKVIEETTPPSLNQPAVNEQLNEQKVLAQKNFIPEPLYAPQLIQPQNNFLTNKNEIELIVFAPQAEVVKVYNNNNKITEKNIINEDVINFNINLEEGAHTIILESVKGEESVFSKEYNLTIDNTPPIIEYDKSYVMIEESPNMEGKIVKAFAFLSADTSAVKVNFNNFEINLIQDENRIEKWAGELIIFEENNETILNPVVLPSLIAQDQAGNTITDDIQWLSITPVKTSLTTQYIFAKDNLPKFIQPLFTLSSIYYKILLTIAIIALLLNIFVEIKKQRPHIILSTIGLIGLLIFFILI